MKSFWAPCIGMLVLASALPAQDKTRFTYDLGAGFTTPVGHTGRLLDTGWGLGGGAGININSHLSLMLNLGYDTLGVNSTTLNSISAPGGKVTIFSARIEPVLHVGSYHHADFYITGGGGIYHRNEQFNQPALGLINSLDPFFGFNPTSIQTNQIRAGYSVNKPGVDGGIGVAFGSKWHGKFFAEARYHRIFLSNNLHTDYLPVTVGFRW